MCLEKLLFSILFPYGWLVVELEQKIDRLDSQVLDTRLLFECQHFHQKVSRQREIVRHLPEAWKNLVSGASEDSEYLIEAVKSETQHLCGNEPTNEQVRSFLNSLKKEEAPAKRITRSIYKLAANLGKQHLREGKLKHVRLFL